MQLQRNAIIADSYADALALADLAEAIERGEENTANPIFEEWADAAGIAPYNHLLVFATSFHVLVALGALRWFRDNATPPVVR